MDAFRTPRFRSVLVATTMSAMAAWLCSIAVIAGMLQVGRSSVDVGLFNGAWTLAGPVAVILGGLLTDRLGPSIVVLGGLAGSATGYLLLAGVMDQHGDGLTTVLVLAAVIGAAEGFSGVGTSVLAAAVVPAQHMGSAIGMMLIPIAGSRIASGLLAGPLVSAAGTASALLLCGLLAITALLIIGRIGRVRLSVRPSTSLRDDLRLGVRWYRLHAVGVAVVLIGGVLGSFVYGFFVLMPVVASDVLGRDAATQGAVTALGGVGVAVAVLSLGRLRRRLGLGPLLLAVATLAGLGMFALGVLGSALAVIALAVLVPLCTNSVTAVSGIILQGLTLPAMRGRVLGLNALVGAVLLPLGMVGAGWLGGIIGVRTTLVVLGALTTGCIVLIARARPALGRIRVASISPMPTAAAVLELDPLGFDSAVRILDPEGGMDA